MIHRSLRAALAAVSGLAAVAAATGAGAQDRITYKSAKSATSYYQMAVQVAEAIKAGTGGKLSVTVEESQGSVQNVKEAAKRGHGYVFTSPPVLVALARGGKAMFKDANPAYGKIRALFPIPSLTMHFVTRADAKVARFADLAGKRIVLGKGSFGAREGAKYLKLFGVAGKVTVVNVELNAAVPALKNGQIDGFVTAGSFPAPNVLEAAAATRISILSLSADEIAKTKRTRLVIPAGTYPGIDRDVVTTSLPVVAYGLSAMSEPVAYAITKAFWQQKARMGKANAWWNGVDAASLAVIRGKIHPGALKYYVEAGMPVPKTAR